MKFSFLVAFAFVLALLVSLPCVEAGHVRAVSKQKANGKAVAIVRHHRHHAKVRSGACACGDACACASSSACAAGSCR